MTHQNNLTFEEKLKKLEYTPQRLFEHIVDCLDGWTDYYECPYSFRITNKDEFKTELIIDLRKLDQLKTSVENEVFYEDDKKQLPKRDDIHYQFVFKETNEDNNEFRISVDWGDGDWDVDIMFTDDGEINNKSEYIREFKLLPLKHLKYNIERDEAGYIRADYPQFTDEEWEKVISDENVVEFKFD